MRTHSDEANFPLLAMGGRKVTPSFGELQRISVRGKFFYSGSEKWHLKGLTYGPFSPNEDGDFLPSRQQVKRDFAQIRAMGGNCLRVYHVPPVWLADEAAANGLRLQVDVPWEKHRCFFEDWSAQEDARQRVREAARQLGNHPGVFALSVANELPGDVVRFYGAKRVERFVDELLEIVKEEAPQCLACFANYPPTEFLQPTRQDFCCFNVYLHDPQRMGEYLDRLQHISGAMPLVLGEFGMDSLRHGEEAQARMIGTHARQIYGHGLAGAFIFAFTDDWFTGGHAIEDWAFGITRRDRSEKPAARELSEAWASVPCADRSKLPRVSVVVCSYNGAATLDECLNSLSKLDYPDVELILVDDGSTDHSQQIAVRYPQIINIRQPNRGLSAARNVGLERATGQIVAYTDSDCVVEPDWLLYLVQAMADQGVEAIGGPNVPPPSDSWTARCVAGSPGGPSHVMLDDRQAEHVPGCNMAFRRETLRKLGGFDVRFRQAGDDVDVCWRLIDAGYRIGYAASALVWHHRRNTVGAYLKQQKGYGRSEAMLHFKHPQRFNLLGCSQWKGVIYGEGAVGLPVPTPAIYHGRFGSGLFQSIYRSSTYSNWAYFTLLEWHGLAALMMILSLVIPPLWIVAAVMWAATLAAALRATLKAPLPSGGPWWCRPVIFGLHVMQPVVRAAHRYYYRIRHKRAPMPVARMDDIRPCLKRISLRTFDLYWNSQDGRGREALLDTLVRKAQQMSWPGDFHAEWAVHDLELSGDMWHKVRVRTATEELGWPKRFTRVRCEVRFTHFGRVALVLAGAVSAAAVSFGLSLPLIFGISTFWGFAGVVLWMSQRRCRSAVARLVWRAGRRAGLRPVILERPVLSVGAEASTEAEEVAASV